MSITPCESPEPLGTEGVEADRDPAESGASKCRRVLSEEDPIGGHGKVGEPGARGEHRDEPGQVLPEEWLAPGKPDLVHAEVDEYVDELADFLE